MYLQQFDYKGKIYITDDSDEKYYKLNNKIINNFKNKISVIHEQGEGKNFSKRHQRFIVTKYKALKNIKTSFYTHISDDDLLYPDFLKNSIDFLKKNDDYSVVNGIGLIVYFNNYFEIKKINNLKWPENELEDPLDRLNRYIEPEYATQPMMAVCRTESLSSLFDLEKVIKYKPLTRDGQEGLEMVDEEIPWVCQLLISGKLKSLPEVSQIIAKTSFAEGMGMNDRVENYKYHKGNEFKVFRLGSIENILNGSMTSAAVQTKKELIELIKIVGSKYNQEDIDDEISRIIWKIIKASNGNNNILLTDFAKEYNLIKKKRKKLYFQFKIINFFYFITNYNFFLKIYNYLKRKKINLESIKIHNKYKNFHESVKQNFLKLYNEQFNKNN